MKRLLINAVLLCAGFLAGALLVEGILRIFYHAPLGDNPFSGYLKYDPEMSFDIAPNAPLRIVSSFDGHYRIWSNELGCFDEPYQGEKPHVLLVGDSFMWGYCDYPYKFGTNLQRMLGIRVVKAGVLNTGTRQQYLKARRIIERIGSPALIVVGYYMSNDLEDDAVYRLRTVLDGKGINCYDAAALRRGEDRWDKPITLEPVSLVTGKKHGKTFSLRTWVRENSVLHALASTREWVMRSARALHLVAAAQDAAAKIAVIPADGSAIAARVWPQHADNIRAFAKLARENNSNLLFVLIPDSNTVYNQYEAALSAKVSHARKTVIDFLAAEHIAYIDLTEPLQAYARSAPAWRRMVYISDGHWNKRGNRLAAQLTAAFITTHDLMRPQ